MSSGEEKKTKVLRLICMLWVSPEGMPHSLPCFVCQDYPRTFILKLTDFQNIDKFGMTLENVHIC